MENKIELKPCPFCGEKARIKSAKYNTLGIYGDSTTQKQWWAIECHECKISQPIRYYFSKSEAAEAWNRRAEQTDTKPIKTGEWLEDEYAYFRCSECGYEQDQPETVTPYCPGCGAHMEDESEVTED